MELKFIIKEQKIKCTDSKTVAANSKNYLCAAFEFDDSWNSYSKKAVFENRSAAYSQILDDDRCVVPFEVITAGGFDVSVIGLDPEGECRITTSRVRVEVEPGPSLDAQNAAAPTLTEMEQLIALAANAKQIAEDVRADADNGVFDGKDGNDGYTPVKDVDYRDGEDGATFEVFSDIEILKAYPSTVTAGAVRFLWTGENTEYSYRGLTAVLKKFGLYDGDMARVFGERVFRIITEISILPIGDADKEKVKEIIAEYLADNEITGEVDPEELKQAIDDYFVENPIELPEVPTKTSDLENDSGFVDKTVNNLVNYYLKNETYTREEVKALLSAIPKFAIQPVDELPTEDISITTVYLLKYGEDAQDLYQEYIYVNGAWEYLGSQKVDLSGYATEAWVNIQLGSYLKQSDLTDAINTALAQAKASGEFDGKDGIDGNDGKDGINGVDGQDGYTPVKGVDYFDGAPGRDGTNGADGRDGYTPVRGTDYWTPSDIAEIKSYVNEAILGGAW